jgi:HAD superfamily hydrolase (TIGR01509 family)
MVFIFDMDGVIVDNHQWHFEAWFEFGRRHGLNISQEEFSRYFGSTNHLVLKSLFGDTISEQEITTMGNEKEAIYRELYRPFIKPVDGLPLFLQNASDRGIPMALATSAPFENVKFTLEATGLKRYFNVITDSSMVSRGKPDPQVYQVTAAKLGVQPSECIVFEDSVPGILSAKSAGMRVIGVATTHKSDELLMYVNEIIMNFDAADKQIDQWLKSNNS